MKPHTHRIVYEPERTVIVITGSPLRGFDVFGPFPDLESAEVWIKHRGLTVANSWIAAMTKPLDS